jgi:hypothetical protein
MMYALMLLERITEMNQDEWLACNDPRVMLDAMASRISDRQLKIFSVACYDQIQQFLSEEAKAAVKALKADINGEIESNALTAAEELLESELFDSGSSGTRGGIISAYVISLFDPSALKAAQDALKAVDKAAPWTLDLARKQPDVYEAESVKVQRAYMTVLAERLREIVGNPF